MPYVITGNLDDDRVVVVERDRRLAREFFFPLARGEKPTAELLAKMPDPYFVLPPNKGGIPAIINTGMGVWTVKENVKAILEELEPNVHNFIPVNLRVKGHKDEQGQYYLLLAGQAIDAVVIEETDFVGGKGREGFEIEPTFSSFGNTVLKAEPVAGAHLWRGAWGRQGESVPFAHDLFCSDKLTNRIEAAGLEGWEFRPCKLKTDES